MSHSTAATEPINDGLAECIAFYALREHQLVIGLTNAEDLSQTARNHPDASLPLWGLDAETGRAREVTLDVSDLHRFIADQVRAIAFTHNVSELLIQSFARAVVLGHGYVGQEHLVAAIAESTDTEVATALGALGTSGAALLERLSPYLQPLEQAKAVVPGWSPRAVRALNLAVREAGDVRPGSTHLILGVIADGEGVGAATFARAGISLRTARQQLLGPS